jgi:hypothetical protein
VTAGTDTGAGLDFGIFAGISAGIGRIAEAVEAQRRSEQMCQQAIRSVPIKPHQQTVTGGAVTFLSHEHDLGPRDGYAWAVQRVTAAGLAANDILSVYKGPPVSQAADPTNLANILTSTSPAWHPGRTGLILQPGDTLVLAGTSLSATAVTILGEVIQMELWLLPQFLL